MTINCPYCGRNTRLVSGKTLFYDIPDTHSLWYYVCKPCNARVRAHKGNKGKPLGLLQNSALRRIKRHLNAKLYVYRKHYRLTRVQIMNHLSNVLGKEVDYNNLTREDGELLLSRLFSRLKLVRMDI